MSSTVEVTAKSLESTTGLAAGTITEKMALAVSATKIIWLDAAL